MQDEHQKVIREGRMSSLLHATVSRFIQEHSNKDSFITVSYVQMTSSRHTVTVYCSIFPKEYQDKALMFLKRKEHDCYEYVRKHTSLRFVPTIRFSLAKDAEGIHSHLP